MDTQQISFHELSALSKTNPTGVAFKVVLSVIPGGGCRLFVNYRHHCLFVVDEDGEPKYFPSVEIALIEIATIDGIDHHVTVDIISLLPRPMSRSWSSTVPGIVSTTWHTELASSQHS